MSPRDGILQISDAEEPGLWAGQASAREPNGPKGKPFTGSSLYSNTPQGRETAACLGKDRRSAGFGSMLRPAHLIVLMQLSISRLVARWS